MPANFDSRMLLTSIQTPSVKNYFGPVGHAIPPSKTRIWTPQVPAACQQLRGNEYIEYILRTLTRSLGGVSSRKRAQVIREIFPYKPFSNISPTPINSDNTTWSAGEESDAEDENVKIKCEVPEDGNEHLRSSMWTEVELTKHDESLKAWARWEVDYGAKVVRSTKCQRTTTERSGVCTECQVVSNDESFKLEVRKVIDSVLGASSHTEQQLDRKIVKQHYH